MTGQNGEGAEGGAGDWVVDDQKRTIKRRRSTGVVRVRKLNCGPTPTIGLTIPAKVLNQSGLEVGNRVYVLVEEEGRLIVEKVARDFDGGRQRDRSQLIALRPNEQKYLREELLERVRNLEMDVVDLETSGNRKGAKLRMARADRVRWLIRKVCGGWQ